MYELYVRRQYEHMYDELSVKTDVSYCLSLSRRPADICLDRLRVKGQFVMSNLSGGRRQATFFADFLCHVIKAH